MPFYEYQCKACGAQTEVLQKITDAPLKKCPECGKNQLTKLVSARVFRLKGSGWYETDFKTDKDNKRNLVETEKAETKPADKAESKSETKPEARRMRSPRRKPSRNPSRNPPRNLQRSPPRNRCARRRRSNPGPRQGEASMKRLLRWLRRYLVTGLLVWVPLGVTLLTFRFLLDLADEILPLLPARWQPDAVLGFHVPGFGVIFALVVLLGTGILLRNLIGSTLVGWWED